MKSLLKNLNKELTEQTPFWLMRQAGRYLPEYRELRAEKGGFLAMAYDPKAACEITMQPIRRYGMDGAIIFSDILTIPHALGQDLQFVKGEGPKLPPLRSKSDFEMLSFDDFETTLQPVYDALSLTSKQLSVEGFDHVTLLGFAGAPWTVATYMVEGGGSKDYINIKALAYGQPDIFQALIDLITEATSRYLIKQIEAGAEAVKIFDSWAGVLDPDQFEQWAIKPVQRIVESIKAVYPDTPVIGFPRGAGMNYPKYAAATGVDCCAFDSMMPLEWIAEHVQPHCTVQGNMDPAVLLAGGDIMEKKINEILKVMSKKPFIFNLGHGINLQTPPEHVERLTALVHGFRR